LIRFVIIFALVFLSVHINVAAQVLNIDREKREDSVLKTWDLAVGLSLSSDKQKRNLLESNTNLEFVRNLPSRYFVAGLLRNDLEYNGPTQIQNEGLVHFRFRDRDTRKYSPELFIQSIWNRQWDSDGTPIKSIKLDSLIFMEINKYRSTVNKPSLKIFDTAELRKTSYRLTDLPAYSGQTMAVYRNMQGLTSVRKYSRICSNFNSLLIMIYLHKILPTFVLPIMLVIIVILIG